MKDRLLLDGASIVAILFLPFWAVALLLLSLAVRWRAWEIVAFALLFDLLYVVPGSVYLVPFPMTLLSCLALAILEPIRQRLRNS